MKQIWEGGIWELVILLDITLWLYIRYKLNYIINFYLILNRESISTKLYFSFRFGESGEFFGV